MNMPYAKKRFALLITVLVLAMALAGCIKEQSPVPTAPGGLTTVTAGQLGNQTQDPAATPTAALEMRVVSLSDPNSTLNVREQPSTDAEIVIALKNGASITVIGTEDDWLHIQTADGQQGYVKASFTVPAGQATNGPTNAPTATQGNTPTMAPGQATPAPGSSDYGLITATAAVSMSYFDDALFVGDSVSYGFSLYVNKQRNSGQSYLGKSIFLTAGSFGIHHAITSLSADGSVHPSYEGKKWLIEDFMAEKGFKKVYIMLGMNDIALYGIDQSVSNYAELISRIRVKVPDAKIYIQSVTPTTKDGAKAKLNNPNIYAFNDKMHLWARENSCYFLDIASVLRDSAGNLPTNLSNDNFVHLADAAFPLWVEYLRTHTK